MNSPPARVVIVAGPPCSGKSTYVEEHQAPGDLVIDYDQIAQELGSPVQWMHSALYATQAEIRTRTLIDRLPGHGPGTAWVIRSLANSRHRATTARKTRAASCLLMALPMAVCLDRAKSRPDGTEEQIRRWYAAYRPWSGDTLARSLTTRKAGEA